MSHKTHPFGLHMTFALHSGHIVTNTHICTQLYRVVFKDVAILFFSNEHTTFGQSELHGKCFSQSSCKRVLDRQENRFGTEPSICLHADTATYRPNGHIHPFLKPVMKSIALSSNSIVAPSHMGDEFCTTTTDH